jgi:protein TonB
MQNRPELICAAIALMLHMLVAYSYFYHKPTTGEIAVEPPKGLAVKLDSQALQNLLHAEQQKRNAARKVIEQAKKMTKHKVVKRVAVKPKKINKMVKPVLLKAKVKRPTPIKTVYAVQDEKVLQSNFLKVHAQTVAKPVKAVRAREAVKVTPVEAVKHRQASTQVAAYTSAEAGKSVPAAKEAGASHNQKPIKMNSAMKRYIGKLMRHLNQFKHYPANEKKERIEGTPVVRFRVNAKGELALAEVKKRSGSKALDNAAIALFNRANPFPKIPKSMSRNSLTMSLPVEYSLDE